MSSAEEELLQAAAAGQDLDPFLDWYELDVPTLYTLARRHPHCVKIEQALNFFLPRWQQRRQAFMEDLPV